MPYSRNITSAAGAAVTRGSEGAVTDRREALKFSAQFFQENPGSRPEMLKRMHAICDEIEETGTYWHTPEELTWGARVAWRNASRCIGRLYWNNLRVRDLRDAATADDVAQGCFDHLRESWRDGRIRPTITIFPPDTPGIPPVRIWNEQLIRYAGYQDEEGQTFGDGQYFDFTCHAESLGWQGEGGQFDVLPLLVETPSGVSVHPLPEDAVEEVAIVHPEFPWFAELGLRWHAIPAIANMRLEIGGVSYSAAPFNGWYVQTEIAVRNLVDPHRYDKLPLIADRLGLDMSSERTLWRDRALVELNRAVLHSFDEAGVAMSDHHTESRRFLDHLAREERSGRSCPADWSWIVPPISGGITPVYHRYYDQEDLRPAFLLDAHAKRRSRGPYRRS